MALHNRQLKSGWWTDGDLLRWPLAKRVLYMGMFCVCDDSACIELDAFSLKMVLFPSPSDADVTVEKIEAWLSEMEKESKLIVYDASGKRCAFLRNFHRHQKLHNPAKPEVPLPSFVSFAPSSNRYRSGMYTVTLDEDAYSVGTLSQNCEKKEDSSDSTVTDKSQNCDDEVTVSLSLSHSLSLSNNTQGVVGGENTPKRGRPKSSVPDTPSPEFEAFWSAYPRKEDKFAAWRRFWEITEKEHTATPEQLLIAAKAFAVEMAGKEKGFIKMGSTFLSAKDKHYLGYISNATAPAPAPAPRPSWCSPPVISTLPKEKSYRIINDHRLYSVRQALSHMSMKCKTREDLIKCLYYLMDQGLVAPKDCWDDAGLPCPEGAIVLEPEIITFD